MQPQGTFAYRHIVRCSAELEPLPCCRATGFHFTGLALQQAKPCIDISWYLSTNTCATGIQSCCDFAGTARNSNFETSETTMHEDVHLCLLLLQMWRVTFTDVTCN